MVILSFPQWQVHLKESLNEEDFLRFGGVGHDRDRGTRSRSGQADDERRDASPDGNAQSPSSPSHGATHDETRRHVRRMAP